MVLYQSETTYTVFFFFSPSPPAPVTSRLASPASLSTREKILCVKVPNILKIDYSGNCVGRTKNRYLRDFLKSLLSVVERPKPISRTEKAHISRTLQIKTTNLLGTGSESELPPLGLDLLLQRDLPSPPPHPWRTSS